MGSPRAGCKHQKLPARYPLLTLRGYSNLGARTASSTPGLQTPSVPAWKYRTALRAAKKKTDEEEDEVPSLKEIQERMEREAPGFIANPLPEQKPRREAELVENVTQFVRVVTIAIVALITYAALVIDGDAKLPSWLTDL
uniref:Uncharacterized protein n=1 Tax=Lotharella oceanica TaxID=641309 RepID=A0A7S2TWT6_9EUKA